ncbi:MAG: glycosyltransferase [Pseudomonadota bacterium]
MKGPPPLSLGDMLGEARRYRGIASKVDLATSVESQLRLGASLLRLREDFRRKSGKEQAYVQKRLEKSLQAAGTARQRIILLSLRLHLSCDYGAFVEIFHLARSDALSIPEAYAIWFAVHAFAFTAGNRLSAQQQVKLDRQLRLLYRHVFQRLHAEATTRGLLDFTLEPEADRIMLAGTQFLLGNHAPTQQLGQLARTLTQDLGRKATIVNTSQPPRLPISPFLLGGVANYEKSLDHARQLTLGPVSCAFAQNPHLFVDGDAVRWMVEIVRSHRPAAILSLGSGNLIVDLLRDKVPVIAMPSTANLPIAEPRLFATVQPMTAAAARLLRPLNITQERVRVIPAGFVLPPATAPFRRADHAIAEDAFVAVVVGLRLDEELKDSFIAQLRRMREAIPRLVIVFLGNFAGFEAWRKAHPELAGSVRFLGFHVNLRDAMALGDVFLNPPRQGGGTSAAYALAAGMPIITPPGGDVASVAGPGFSFADAEEATAEAIKLAQDSAYLEARQAAARARWREKSDFTGMAKALLEVAEEAMAI